jgi:hypothetical protein
MILAPCWIQKQKTSWNWWVNSWKKITVNLKEVVFKYDPGEKYLQLVSVRELFLGWDFQEFIKTAGEGRELPDVSKILTQGKALFDLEMSSSLVTLSVKKNENVLGGGTVDKISFSYFLKPDETNSFFIFGFTWDMENLKLSVPNNKEIELAGNIHQWGMKFSLENLTAAFVNSYFDLVKKNYEMSAVMDKEKLRQQQMTMGLTIASEFMKSKPAIKFSISPFKHHFGELEAELNFQFLNLMAPPVGKGMVNIPKINEILAKIAEEKSLSQKTREGLLKLAKKYVVVDENGNGAITFETRQDQPGTFFLNGKPIK